MDMFGSSAGWKQKNMTISMSAPLEKPQNGFAGLKHLRHDIISGIVVSLVSLPLSSGIAIASGVPPIYGLISAVIAGLIFPLIGGAYVTIAGPAAGLAPAIMAVMVAMGGAGDAEHLGAGYHHLLVIIFMVGCTQLVLALFKLARFASIIPVSVVEGMLASIGFLIIVKQLPMFFGFTGKVHAHEFFEFVKDSPEYAQHMTTTVFGVSMMSLVLLFVLGSLAKRVRVFQIVPPQLIAVIFGVVLGYCLNLGSLEGGKFLIKLPETPFHGVNMPDFAGLLARQDLWYAAILGVITLTMIDGVESLATAMAVDRIDPFQRKSEPNRVLLAMGVSNIASSLVGGLTIIPGGVKSKVNIASGGRTLWANFTNAICLIIYLMIGQQWINMIPKGVLAAVLIFTGWKMCEPLVWRHTAKIGREQLALFTFTVLVTLLTDLLIGIVAGVVAKYFLNLVLCSRSRNEQSSSLGRYMFDFFRNPIVSRSMENGELHLHVDRPLVCFNTMKLEEELLHLPGEARSVCLHLDSGVVLIDHTSYEALHHLVEASAHNDVPIRVEGLDRMLRLSKHASSVHIAAPGPSQQAV